MQLKPTWKLSATLLFPWQPPEYEKNKIKISPNRWKGYRENWTKQMPKQQSGLTPTNLLPLTKCQKENNKIPQIDEQYSGNTEISTSACYKIVPSFSFSFPIQFQNLLPSQAELTVRQQIAKRATDFFFFLHSFFFVCLLLFFFLLSISELGCC